jgi:hypothetical protein
MKLTHLRHTTVFALAWMLTTGPAAFAAQPPNGPGGHLRITEVAVEFGEFGPPDTLTITGSLRLRRHLGFGSNAWRPGEWLGRHYRVLHKPHAPHADRLRTACWSSKQW